MNGLTPRQGTIVRRVVWGVWTLGLILGVAIGRVTA